METAVDEIIKRLSKVSESNLTKMLFQAVEKVKEEILKKNKNQLLQGKDVDDKVVGEYSPYTEIFADRDGITTPKTPNSPYNFNWSGEFLKGLYLDIQGEEAIISSTGLGSGNKYTFLTTENLLGSTEKDLQIIIQNDILPILQKDIINILGI